MQGQPDLKPRTGSIGEHFRRLWRKLKRNKILASILLIFVAFRNSHIPYVYEAALWALGFIILDCLFTLIETVNVDRRRHFTNVADARSVLLECIKECYKRDKYVEIKWLGMTMFNAWNTIKLVLIDLHEGSVKNLVLKVAMLDPDWLNMNCVNNEWTKERAIATEGSISAYFRSREAQSLEWRSEISHYAHMPGLHGGLINDKYMIMGVSQWKSGNLEAGECPYYLYTYKEPADVEQMDIFKGWFNYCVENIPVPRSHWSGVSTE